MKKDNLILIGIDTNTGDFTTYRDYLTGEIKDFPPDDSKEDELLGFYSLEDALKIMTDEWICEGNYCNQTIIDLRDFLLNKMMGIGVN